MFYGKKLKPLDSRFKTVENKVRGCVSQVWVRAYLDEDKNVVYEADSDSVLTKGLAALLVTGLSGRPVPEILKVSPDFALYFGLHLSLTPNRNNGFYNLFNLMQKKALELLVKAEKDGDDGVSSTSGSDYVDDVNIGSSNGGTSIGGDEEDLDSGEGSDGSSGDSSSSADLGGRGMRIKEKLEKELSPLELEVKDVSYQHAGHAGVVGSDGETHFNVKIVSKEFEGKSLVKRHRLVYGLLQDELQSGLHALSIEAKTPSEVVAK